MLTLVSRRRGLTVLPLTAVITALLASCSSEPVPLSVALNVIQRDFQHSGAVSLSADAFGTEKDRVAFAANLFQAQCYYQVADPLVAATVKDFTLTLSGSFTNTGKVTGGTVTDIPAIGVEFDTARTKTQQVAVPVTFATISDLPLVYLSQQYSLLDQFEKDAPASDADAVSFRKDARKRIMTGYTQLSSDIKAIIEHYNQDKCTGIVETTKTGSIKPPAPVLEEHLPEIPDSLMKAMNLH